ncbi:MAG: bifunctional DNA-formamidopyrimidine glycosylase/DNA-(apurinic or apyrimidinic site) lyase [Amnibacterium sp.]
MPELPEVEVVRAGLEPAVAGALIAGVEVVEPRSLKRHPQGVADFEERLAGRRIRSAVRRGKFLWFPLDGEPHEAVLAHLGMSGQMLLRSQEADADKQLRVRLVLESPDLGPVTVAFVDQRIFGSLAVDRLVPTADGAAGGAGDAAPLVPAQVAHIARDPLDPAFDDLDFARRLRAKRTGVKRALLDQTLVSGIGNIYADEALWAARLHYDHPTVRLSRAQALALLAELRQVLEKALADGGTSFDAQYVNVNGASGYFAQRLNVYGRQGKPCPRCGTPIVREPWMNRGSHLCPACQLPRRRRARTEPAR